jgi:hypothetical protein
VRLCIPVLSDLGRASLFFFVNGVNRRFWHALGCGRGELCHQKTKTEFIFFSILFYPGPDFLPGRRLVGVF